VYKAMQATVERPQRPDLVAAGTPSALGEAVTTIVGFLDVGRADSLGIRAARVDRPQQVA
jgi:hypothetical protein